MSRRAILLAALLLAGCGGNDDFDTSRQIGPDPVLPEPSQSLWPDLKVATVVGWKEGETPDVPAGLTVTVYAKDLANPRTVHTLPNGDVLVVQSKAPEGKPLNRPKDIIRGWIMAMAAGGGGEGGETNRITLLRDTNRDGAVDEQREILADLNSPFGVAWHDGTLYVAAADAILAYPYELGGGKITARPKILTPLPGGPINHHWTKDLALSPDARFLFVSIGSNSNAGERGIEAEKGRAAIWQVDRQTGAAKVFASGLRNPNGLNFHPQTGELWTVVNERDELGPNLVPDYLTSVKEGGFYGWPWSYYGQHVDPRVHPQRPDMVERAIVPDYALSSHVAALGLAFANDSAMPEAFRDGAFVGNHGSWNRNAFNGYKVIFIPFANGRLSRAAQDVVTGFLAGDEARGRPVGLAMDGTGALLIADDAGNTVWRVAAADGSITAQPLSTDRVSVSVSNDGTSTGPLEEKPGDAATADGSATPAQTDIAPAVSSEDGQ
ncbi:PQQ-dependent sugar dehydrogenase [Shinella sp.]|uniref:PQQ-dependent sugar dehydrogenase n=1 Tax=Shinella sp. TaxID=1870904 RepID=UPI004035A098